MTEDRELKQVLCDPRMLLFFKLGG